LRSRIRPRFPRTIISEHSHTVLQADEGCWCAAGHRVCALAGLERIKIGHVRASRLPPVFLIAYIGFRFVVKFVTIINDVILMFP
jgi:hypothetical protein